MKQYFIVLKFSLLILLFILNSFVKNDELQTEDNVIVITDDNYNEVMKQSDYILVEFYAPWCGHCKQLAPEYSKASIDLKDSNIKLAKVDATENPKFSSMYSIRGYPTLIFFDKGIQINYSGGRKADEITNWLLKKTQISSKELASIKDIDNFVEEGINDDGLEFVLVYLGNFNYNGYVSLMKQLEDNVKFGHCFSEECLTNTSTNTTNNNNNKTIQKGTLAMYRKFSDKVSYLKPGFGMKELRYFIDREGTPLVIFNSQKYSDLIYKNKVPALFIFTDDKSEELIELAEKVAKKIYKKLQVVISSIDQSEEDKKLAEYVYANNEDVPNVKIADARVQLKVYKLEITKKHKNKEILNLKNIIKFVDDWDYNRITAQTKSEPIPDSQGNVYKLVGKTFNKIVKDKNKDVLVKYHAPWCGHCKKVAPIYEDLARKLSNSNNLVIAEVDATQNDTDNFKIGGFPTFHLFKANDKKNPVNFEGDRTLDGFVKFVKDNAYFPVNYKEDL